MSEAACQREKLSQEYSRRRAASAAEAAQWEVWRDRWTQALLVDVALGVAWMWQVVHHNESLWPMGVVLALGIFFGVLKGRARRRATAATRRVEFYDRGLGRLSGEGSQTGLTGDAFSRAQHLYERDLNVLGPDSLFSLLATTRTTLGQRALAGFLLEPADAAKVRRRQEAVRELTPLIDLRERAGLLGHFGFEDLAPEGFESWLHAKPSRFPGWLRPVLATITAGWIAVLLVGLVLGWDTGFVVRNVALVLVVQVMVCAQFRRRVLAELEAVKPLAGKTPILREGVRLLAETTFSAERLVELQREVESKDRVLARFERSLMIMEQRSTDFLYVLGLFFAMGTQVAFGLDAWKRAHAADLRRWLAAWAEFETLLALATYAAEHPENSFPEIVENSATSSAVFEAEAMAHPLLRRGVAVANDVSFGGEAQFLLVSGSNMAGKSTLLRAIGANVVLALAGAPVPARSLRMKALRIGASIVVGDSLAEGKSKFLAEVERLRAIVDLACEHPGGALFLIDEVLSGTNSLDRKVAAESVLRSLVATGAVGALSTHDLTLAALAELNELHGRNVHMASAEEDDPLAFDYLLKDGSNRMTNAMAIVRLLGLG